MMARMKSMSSLEAKIAETKRSVEAAKVRYDRLCEELLALETEREQVMAREIMLALKASRKSYKELMVFLGD